VNPIAPLWDGLLGIIGGLLAFFYQIIPVYGIAIILLTLTIGLIMFPLTLKQTRSMKAMQEIQPEVKRLQKELKGDREELNKELMELYKERGVNPAAGCLPLIVQMPIWFALFSVLRTGGGIPEDSALYADTEPARELLDLMRAAESTGIQLSGTFESVSGEVIETVSTIFDPVTFLGMNLLISPADAFGLGFVTFLPYAVLLVVIVAAGYYQQVQTTRNRSGAPPTQQAQTMQNAMKIMPVFFGFISWTLPSGLDLYFATSNLFRIGQQAIILRMDEGKGGDGKQPASPPDQPAEDGDSGSGPSPHASKKRKGRRRK
jgi:YidC/Oxa1 family membrane protein insertase